MLKNTLMLKKTPKNNVKETPKNNVKKHLQNVF